MFPWKPTRHVQQNVEFSVKFPPFDECLYLLLMSFIFFFSLLEKISTDDEKKTVMKKNIS